MSSDTKQFRTVLGHYPTGISVITSHLDGENLGMVVGTFNSVSLEPPLVAFMPAKTSTTWPKIRASGKFCVNVLGEDQQDICQAFSRRKDDKFDGIQWQLSPTGAPIIEGVVAWVDCEIVQVVESGDHYIVIGRVNGLDTGSQSKPLMFFKGGYSGLGATKNLSETSTASVTEQISAFMMGSAGGNYGQQAHNNLLKEVPDPNDDVYLSRAVIVEEVLVNYMSKLVTTCQQVLANKDNEQEVLESLIEVLFTSINDHRGAVILYQNKRSFIANKDNSELLKKERELSNIWEQCIERGKQKSIFRQDVKPKILYYMIRDAVFIVARWHNDKGKYSLDEISSQYRRTILDGVVARSV